MFRLLSRSAIATVTAVLLSTLPIAPTHAHTTEIDAADRAKYASTWLSTQLVDGNHMEATVDGENYPSYGLTADTVLALTSARVDQPTRDATMGYLTQTDSVSGYIGDGTTMASAGATAKLLFTAGVAGVDPTNVGGVDLVARLQSLQQGSGRFTDIGEMDYSNVTGQAFAVLGLVRSEKEPTTAVQYLVSTQCEDGSFPSEISDEECTGDVDSTAVALSALYATDTSEGIDDALAWLLDQQSGDGSFSSDASGENTPNANSTGLAAAVLADAGQDEAFQEAREWLSSLQSGCSTPAEQRGAIAETENGFDAKTAPRATAQAVLGLGHLSLAALATSSEEARTGENEAPAFQCGEASDANSEDGASKKLLAGIGVLVLIGVAVGFVLWRRRKSQDTAK